MNDIFLIIQNISCKIVIIFNNLVWPFFHSISISKQSKLYAHINGRLEDFLQLLSWYNIPLCIVCCMYNGIPIIYNVIGYIRRRLLYVNVAEYVDRVVRDHY